MTTDRRFCHPRFFLLWLGVGCHRKRCGAHILIWTKPTPFGNTAEINPTDALKSLHFMSMCFHWSLWVLRSTRSLWCFIIILSVFEINILHFLTISSLTVVDNMFYSFIMFNVRHSSRRRKPDHIRSSDYAFKYITPSFCGYFPISNEVETFHKIVMLMAFFAGLQTWCNQ